MLFVIHYFIAGVGKLHY